MNPLETFREETPPDALKESRICVSDEPIDVFRELENLGVSDSDGLLFSAPDRQTSHFLTRVITCKGALPGEPARMEIYTDRENPHRFIWIMYREELGPDGERVVHNQFFTNDPEYARRKSWMKLCTGIPDLRGNVNQAVSQTL